MINQVLTHFQETKKEVALINDKANSCIEQMNFQVQFLEEDYTIREANVVVTKVAHLLHSLIITEDVNSYQSGSHLRYMLRAHTWKTEMQRLIDKVGDNVAIS